MCKKWSNGCAVCCCSAAELIGGECLYSVRQSAAGPACTPTLLTRLLTRNPCMWRMRDLKMQRTRGTLHSITPLHNQAKHPPVQPP
ncbi:hypothetical protein JZ751_029567 [Albula glossodonta]|uniref:Uncharacterized protein n=1 Tax=Albula glossodonta TaxID=121402 RepID=A0A8T2NEG6_9TELE|nr:hypothetical protein JZ751_029567 [Albula glossodonta]